MSSRFASASSRISCEKTATRSLPAALAAYIAMSASRTIISTSVPDAMPAEAEMRHVAVAEEHRAVDRPEHALDGLLRELGTRVVEEDAEFVSTEARHEVVRADRRRDPCADRAHEVVAAAMTKRVVDGLEVVEIEERHGDDELFVGRFELGLRQRPSIGSPARRRTSLRRSASCSSSAARLGRR